MITAALLLATTTARAQPKPPPDKFTKAAGEAFAAAVAADTAGDLRTALGLYQKAHAISPHPATMFNIGDLQRRLNLLPAAIKSLETYIAMAPDAKDRAAVEKTLEVLYQTPGTIFLSTVDASNPEALDLASGYALVDGDLKRKPGAVETHKLRNIPVIALTVPPGEHVIDLVTPLTYASRECSVGPGEERLCELRAAPRIDGNVVVSAASRQFWVQQDRRGGRLVGKRFELPAGRHRLLVRDRSYHCAPLAVTVPTNPNLVAYSFLHTREVDGIKRCRTSVLRQYELKFDP